MILFARKNKKARLLKRRTHKIQVGFADHSLVLPYNHTLFFNAEATRRSTYLSEFGDVLRGDLTSQLLYRLTPKQRLSEKGSTGRSPSLLSFIIICFHVFVNIGFTEMLYHGKKVFGQIAQKAFMLFLHKKLKNYVEKYKKVCYNKNCVFEEIKNARKRG